MKYLTCRLRGKELKITDKVLCDILHLKTTGARQKPEKFDVHKKWAALSPCKSFNKRGSSAGKPVCLLPFLKQALWDTKNKAKMRIGWNDLQLADLVTGDRKLKHYSERKCYKAYQDGLKKAAAAGSSEQTVGGSSQQATEEPTEHASGDEEQPDQTEYHAPTPPHGSLVTLPQQAPTWFIEYQKRQDEYMRAIHAEVSSYNARVEAYITENDKRWTNGRINMISMRPVGTLIKRMHFRAFPVGTSLPSRREHAHGALTGLQKVTFHSPCRDDASAVPSSSPRAATTSTAAPRPPSTP
ncbi:DNA-directed RNA polymerase subunit beta'' [Striga asiatica]|uniref:DNA-directed RNA polymerase subunit beta n=1 Tax=Striga asiatica TaxID=4170 RepID=A0A5A7PM82_STRAF|nr:DNA-directed RNA polymerase subunit beta'' [Striga asiatica]